MRIIIPLFLTVFIPFISLSQIPNGGFEGWEMVNNKEKPVFWESNQDTIHRRIFKDSVSVEGNYSIRFESDVATGWSECTSKIATLTGFEEPLEGETIVSFYLKLQPLDPTDLPHFFLLIRPSLEGTLLNSFVWQTENIYDEFTFIELPLPYAAMDTVYIEIGAGALNGADDGCYNQNICWLDGFEMKGRTTAVEEFDKDAQVRIYPNPSTGKIHLGGEISDFESFVLYDLDGKIIQASKIENLGIEIPKKGTFIIELNSENKSIKNHRQLVFIK